MTAVRPQAHQVAFEPDEPELLTPVRLLLIGHNPEDDALLREVLAGSEWSVWSARTLADAARLLEENAFSVAICESDLLDGSWRDVLNRVASLDRGPHVIVASRLADASLWAEALNVGACDVLSKPFSSKEILHAVGYASAWVGSSMPEYGSHVERAELWREPKIIDSTGHAA